MLIIIIILLAKEIHVNIIFIFLSTATLLLRVEELTEQRLKLHCGLRPENQGLASEAATLASNGPEFLVHVSDVWACFTTIYVMQRGWDCLPEMVKPQAAGQRRDTMSLT